MEKMVRKLTLHRETVCALSDLRSVVGAANTQERTVCLTGCVTNCAACNFSLGTNCC